jgi:hypothetical protein
MDVRLPSARKFGRSLFEFGVQTFIDPRSVSSESEHPSTKQGPLESEENSEKNCNDFGYISVTSGHHIPE